MDVYDNLIKGSSRKRTTMVAGTRFTRLDCRHLWFGKYWSSDR